MQTPNFSFATSAAGTPSFLPILVLLSLPGLVRINKVILMVEYYVNFASSAVWLGRNIAW